VLWVRFATEWELPASWESIASKEWGSLVMKLQVSHCCMQLGVTA